MDVDREGTHITHCCAKHGCKYSYGFPGEDTCPVYDHGKPQEYPCEWCVDVREAEDRIKELQEEIAFVKSLSVHSHDTVVE